MDFGKTKREYRGSICTKSQQSKKLESAFKTPTKGGAPQASRCIIAKYLENVNRCSKAVDENEELLAVLSYDAAFEVFDRTNRCRGMGHSEEAIFPEGI